mgnify:CR=1 FL=1
MYNGTDLWTSSWVNSMAKKIGGVDPPQEIFIEYARKVVLPGEGKPTIRPVWTLDFANVGRGVTYRN